MIVPASDPQLGGILRTQLRVERLRAVRILLLTILAFDGAVVWLDAVKPPLAHTEGGLFFLLAWPPCFIGYILVRGVEVHTQAQVDRLLARDCREEGPRGPCGAASTPEATTE